MSTVGELAGAVAGLAGVRVAEFTRTLNIATVGFERGVAETRLHAQCPFRVTRGEQTLLGSVDMYYPGRPDEDPAVAYREYTTMFDRKAQRLTERFRSVEYVVESAELGRAGMMTLWVTDSVVIEVFPACAGPVEQWRFFGRDTGVHHVFPEEKD